MRTSPLRLRRSVATALISVMIAIVATAASAIPTRAQIGSCAPARTALVLGGGGAKGLVHLGVLQALDSLGVVPDLIVGTSIGAIVGALYASGETGASAQALMKRMQLHTVIRAYEPVVSTSLEGLRPIVVWERERTRWLLQTGAVREGEVSAILSRLALRGNLIARGDFDSLTIPFRAVATGLEDRSVVVLSRGDLGLALRASMSIPLLFRPVHIDGRALVDGGLASNRPVSVARALGAERVIVSTIASPPPDSKSFDDPLTVTSALFDYLWVQDTLDLGPDDVLIAQPTEPFGPLDFRPFMIDSLVGIGRRTSDAAFAAASCVRPINTSRRVPGLPLLVGQARVVSTEVGDRDVILGELALTPETPLEIGAVSAGLARFASNERYRGLWLNPGGDARRVTFDVEVDPAPERSFGIGFAFDHTMSGRVWVGAVDRTLFGRDLEGASLFTLGTYRTDLTLAARRRARLTRRSLPIGGSVEIAAEDVRRYEGRGELPVATTTEFVALLGVRPLFEPGWTQEIGADYRLFRAPGQPVQGTAGARYALRLRRVGAPEPLIEFEGIALHAWQRWQIDISRTDTLGGVELRPRMRVGVGRKLPIQHTFALGGIDGFAGLRSLELRGDHELFGSLLLRWPLSPWVLGRVETMVGMIGVGGFDFGPGSLDGIVFTGVRMGIEIDTPIGPIRVEQGFNNQNRRQALIRVGHWF